MPDYLLRSPAGESSRFLLLGLRPRRLEKEEEEEEEEGAEEEVEEKDHKDLRFRDSDEMKTCNAVAPSGPESG